MEELTDPLLLRIAFRMFPAWLMCILSFLRFLTLLTKSYYIRVKQPVKRFYARAFMWLLLATVFFLNAIEFFDSNELQRASLRLVFGFFIISDLIYDYRFLWDFVRRKDKSWRT